MRLVIIVYFVFLILWLLHLVYLFLEKEFKEING